MKHIIMQCPFDENDKPPWLVGLSNPAEAKRLLVVLQEAWQAAKRIYLGQSDHTRKR